MNFINLFSYPILVTEISLNLRELENYCLNLQEEFSREFKRIISGQQFKATLLSAPVSIGLPFAKPSSSGIS